MQVGRKWGSGGWDKKYSKPYKKHLKARKLSV